MSEGGSGAATPHIAQSSKHDGERQTNSDGENQGLLSGDSADNSLPPKSDDPSEVKPPRLDETGKAKNEKVLSAFAQTKRGGGSASREGFVIPLKKENFNINFVVPRRSKLDPSDLGEGIEINIREQGLVILWGKPGTGRQKAAERAAKKFIDNRDQTVPFPNGELGIYVTKEGTPLEDALREVNRIATNELKEQVGVFIVRHSLEGIVNNDATEGWHRLDEAIGKSNACLIVFWESNDKPERPCIEWKPYYAWADVFGCFTSPEDPNQILRLGEEFASFFETCSIGQLKNIACDWETDDYNLVSLRRSRDAILHRREQGRESLVDSLLNFERSESEIAWVIASCVLSGTSELALSQGIRTLASILQIEYRPSKVDLSVSDRLGWRTQRQITAADGSYVTGKVEDEYIATEIVRRFRRVHPDIYLKFVIDLGKSPNIEIQHLAADRALELCAENSELWDVFDEEWRPIFGLIYPRLLAGADRVPSLQGKVFTDLENLLLGSAAEQIDGIYALSFGACEERRISLFQNLLTRTSSQDGYPWPPIHPLILASIDESSKSAGDLLLALATWQGPKEKKKEVWSPTHQVERITVATDAFVASLSERDEEFSVFDPHHPGERMIYGWIRLLRRVFNSESLRFAITEIWFRIFVRMAKAALREKEGPMADWVRCTAEVLSELPGDPGLTAWASFKRWLSGQFVDREVEAWIGKIDETEGGRDFEAIFRSEHDKWKAKQNPKDHLKALA